MTPEQEKRAKLSVFVVGGGVIAYGIWNSVSAWQNRPKPLPPPAEASPADSAAAFPEAAPTRIPEAAPGAPTPDPSPAPSPIPAAGPPPPLPPAVAAQPAPERDPFFPVPPPPRPPPAALPPPPRESGLSLTAICMATDRPAYAVVNGSVVSEGEQVPGEGGWLLKTIRENGVLLLKDGKEYSLTLK